MPHVHQTGLASPFVVSAQTLLDGLPDVEQCFVNGFALGYYLHVMPPRHEAKDRGKAQFCNSLLQFFILRTLMYFCSNLLQFFASQLKGGF